jgi:hypothetical protein
LRKYKTYLLFFHQSNYQLDTSYKYVSLLIVGRGGYGKDTDNAPNAPEWYGGCMGGDSAIVAYQKNFAISQSIDGMWGYETIDFRKSISENMGLYVKFQCYGSTYEVFLGDQKNGQEHRDTYWFFKVNGQGNLSPFIYGRNEGGLATSELVAGAGGSYGNGQYSTSIPGIKYGGVGGDGRYGNQGPEYNSGLKADSTIPVQSIFGGTGYGAGSYFTSTDNCKAGGGGGYGDGNMNGKAGYGAGGTAFKISSSSTDLYNEGDGIVCLYYHNNPL